jgi:hypothetical protein
MRLFVSTLAAIILTTGSLVSQAKELNKNDRFVCSWGAGIAGNAQASKLSGLSLYGARNQLQTHKFSLPWMRMTALGITEQTYDSPSRLKPADIKQTYYEQCISHVVTGR